MGMYDEVSGTLAERIVRKCPNCKKDLYNCEEPAVWQTKCFSNILKTLDLEDIDCDTFEMHTICPHCGEYMSANVTLADGDYNIRTNAFDMKYEQFEDSSLITDYQNSKIDKITNKYTKNWLDYNCINFKYDKDYYKKRPPEVIMKLLDDLVENYYIIPKNIIE